MVSVFVCECVCVKWRVAGVVVVMNIIVIIIVAVVVVIVVCLFVCLLLHRECQWCSWWCRSV